MENETISCKDVFKFIFLKNIVLHNFVITMEILKM